MSESINSWQQDLESQGLLVMLRHEASRTYLSIVLNKEGALQPK